MTRAYRIQKCKAYRKIKLNYLVVKLDTILHNILSLALQLARNLLIREIINSLGNLKLKKQIQSSMTGMQFVLKSLIKNRVIIKSKDLMSDCLRPQASLPYNYVLLAYCFTVIAATSVDSYEYLFCCLLFYLTQG